MKIANKEPQTGYKCPICSDISSIDESKEMKFVSHLMQSNETEYTQKKLCDRCETEIPSKRCLDCKENFCEKCHENHNSWSKLRNHKWEQLTNTTNDKIDDLEHCYDHGNEYIRLYCKQCQKPVCMVCVGENHAGRMVETVEKALLHVIPSTQKQKKNIDKVIQDNNNSLSIVINHAEELKMKCEEIESRINANYENIIKTAREECKHEKEELDRIRRKQFDEIDKYIKDLKLRLESCKNNMSLFESALERAKDASLLCMIQYHLSNRMAKSIQERLQETDIMQPIRANIRQTETKTTKYTIYSIV